MKKFKIEPKTVTGDTVEELKSDLKNLRKIRDIMEENEHVLTAKQTYDILVKIIKAKEKKLEMIKNGHVFDSDEDQS